MNSVEKVKAICKERKIPISRLERELGYGNGYIGQLRKGTFPSDRLVEIANYLGVPVKEILDVKEKTAAPNANGLSEEELKFIEWYRSQASEKDKNLVRMIVEGDK